MHESLSFELFRATLRFRETLDVPPTRRGILLRGAFGITFRRLVCHNLELDCASCPLRPVCAYPAVFAPDAPPGAPRRLSDPPRPFVLRVIEPEAPRIEAGSDVVFRFVLVGRAFQALPYFVVSIQRLGHDGIGKTRARFEVGEIVADGQQARVYDPRTRSVATAIEPRRQPSLVRPGDERAESARVTFVTSTDLRAGGGAVAWPPPFGVLVRRTRDRASALAVFFGDHHAQPADAARMRAAGALADGVRIAAHEGRHETTTRRSARTGERHPIEGVRGWVEYDGEAIGALMPWLRLAEVLHVGKHATFGSGELQVRAG